MHDSFRLGQNSTMTRARASSSSSWALGPRACHTVGSPRHRHVEAHTWKLGTAASKLEESIASASAPPAPPAQPLPRRHAGTAGEAVPVSEVPGGSVSGASVSFISSYFARRVSQRVHVIGSSREPNPCSLPCTVLRARRLASGSAILSIVGEQGRTTTTHDITVPSSPAARNPRTRDTGGRWATRAYCTRGR